jgi:hypothetical protein
MSDSQAVDPQRYPQSAKLIAQESFKSSRRLKCRDTGSSSCCCLASDCISGGQACQRTKRRCYCITWPGATNPRCLHTAAVPARQGQKWRQTGRRQHNPQFQCGWHSCPCEWSPPAIPCACTEALQGDVQKSHDGAIRIPVYLLILKNGYGALEAACLLSCAFLLCRVGQRRQRTSTRSSLVLTPRCSAHLSLTPVPAD